MKGCDLMAKTVNTKKSGKQVASEVSPEVALIMGSQNDLAILEKSFTIFEQFGIPFTVRVMSAHRSPDVAIEFARNAEASGIKILICAAGMAAHLAGVTAGHTILPVIGIPVPSEPFNGLDALLSTVQMPPGIPVGTVTAGKAGGINAALYAISILALNNPELTKKLKAYRVEQTAQVIKADQELNRNLQH